MDILVKRRLPDLEHVTILINSKEYILTLDKYVELIKPILRVEGYSFSYLQLRNKTLFEYFNNEPKEQFSW